MRNLKCTQQPALEQGMWCHPGYVFTVEHDPPTGGWEMASDTVEQGRLAGAVRANQASDTAGFNGQCHIIDGFDAAKMLDQLMNFNHK